MGERKMLEQILRGIQNADAKEIDDILDAAVKRRRQLYPDWEMIYLAAPKKNPEDGEQIWKAVWKNMPGQEGGN